MIYVNHDLVDRIMRSIERIAQDHEVCGYPIMVISTRDPSWTYDPLISEWAEGEGIDTNETWQVEIYLTDHHLHAVVYQWARDDQDHRMWDAVGNEPAYVTYHMTLVSMPPIKGAVGWVKDSEVITC
jgi:hypothetical protein